jgi:hypothetical protein
MKTEKETYNTPVDNDVIEKTIKKIKNDPGPLENPQLITQVAELYKDKQMSAPLEVITVSLAFLNIEAMEMVEEVLKQAKKVTLFTERMKRVEQISKQTEFTKEDIKEVIETLKNLTKIL